MNKIYQIKNHWDELARECGTDCQCTFKDYILRNKEIRAILKYLKNGEKVLDVGCGNGYSTIRFCQTKDLDIIGIDYSEQMIESANNNVLKSKSILGNKCSRIKFMVGDVTNLDFPDSYFDLISTERCLINLPTWKLQMKAIMQIHKKLKSGGRFLMLEGTLDGLKKLNSLRRLVGLDDIKAVWHNNFFNEANLKEFLKKYFHILRIDNFCSSYMIGSRAIYPRFKKPVHGSIIDRIFSCLPNFGDYGYLKLFVLRKAKS